MTTPVGGLRDRLITENLRNLIYDNLDALGWFDAPNAFINNSLTIVTYPVDDDTEILPNIVSVVSEDVSYGEAELGSNLSDFTINCAVDVYAEDSVSGKHLAGDIRAILEGRFASLGRSGTEVDIYDLTLATPSVIFSVDLENIASGKQRFYNKPFQRYWWTIVFDVVDTYNSDQD